MVVRNGTWNRDLTVKVPPSGLVVAYRDSAVKLSPSGLGVLNWNSSGKKGEFLRGVDKVERSEWVEFPMVQG